MNIPLPIRLAAIAAIATLLNPPVVSGDDATSTPWWNDASAFIRNSEYQATDKDGSLQLVNRAQGLRVVAGSNHITIEPRLQTARGWCFNLSDGNVGRDPARPSTLVVTTNDGWMELHNQPAALTLEFNVNPTNAGERTIGRLCSEEEITDQVEDGGGLGLIAPNGSRLSIRSASPQHRLFREGHEIRLRIEPGSPQRARLLLTAKGGQPSTGVSTVPDWVVDGAIPSLLGDSIASAGDVNDDGFSDVIVGAPGFDAGLPDEGRVLLFLGSKEGLRDQPIWTADGGQVGARFGTAVAFAGDVDGDNHDDILVGAPFYTVDFQNEGRAFLYSGVRIPQAQTPDWTFDGRQTRANLGQSVASAGDVNNDGYADFIVGAPRFSSPLATEGAVFGFLGHGLGKRFQANWAVTGGQADARFGTSVAGAGDVDGDGFDDVIVGAPQFSVIKRFRSKGGGREGNVRLYRGSAIGLELSPSWEGFGKNEGERFGSAVAGAGDFNGDGFTDAIIGAPGFLGAAGVIGQAVIYTGSPAGFSDEPTWSTDGEQDAGGYGEAVSSAGDVNGDGFADVLVGAPRFDVAGPESSEGQARLFLGNTNPSTTPNWIRSGEQAESGFGRPVSAAGDVNGDGFGDILIGAPRFSSANTEGRAYAYYGGQLPPSQFPALERTGGVFLGFGVSTAGDLNGDGYSDVVAGDPGVAEALIWLGSETGLPQTPSRSIPSPSGPAFGQSVSTAGDVNGDGFTELLIGDAQGRGTVFLYYGAAAFETDSNPPWSDVGQTPNSGIGSIVAWAGDINGDGFSDFLATAQNAVGSDGGGFYLWTGSATGPGEARVFALDLGGQGRFVRSIASAGDVNGDGFDDVIVGAPSGDNSKIGAAMVLLGSATGLSAAPAWVRESETGQSRYGHAVASAGDVNADGFSDIVIGSPDLQDPRVYVYLGTPSGPAQTPVWTIGEVSAGFGSIVAPAGDLNSDGFSDVLASSRFSVRAYLGGPAGLASSAFWHVNVVGAPQTISTVSSLSTAGSVNGDGVPDVIIGQDNSTTQNGTVVVYEGNAGGLPRPTRQHAVNSSDTPIALRGASDADDGFALQVQGRSAAGRTKLRLEVEVAPQGQGFETADVRLSESLTTDPPIEDGRGSTIVFNETIDALTDGTFYHWRVRTTSDDPLFPSSPWRSLPWNATTETKLRTGGTLPAQPLALIGPAPNEPVFPDSSPMIFSWNRGPHTRFRLEWSSNPVFDSRVVTLNVPQSNDPAGVLVFLPGANAWRDILRLGRNADVRSIPIFWRATPLDGPPRDAPINPTTIRMQPPMDPVMVMPVDDAQIAASAIPTVSWEANHNERYRVLFAVAPEFTPPTISAPETFGTELTDWDDTWDAVVEELAPLNQGRIYWIVFAVDAIDRPTRSDVGRFRILLD